MDSGVYGNRSEHIVAILLLRAPLTCSDNDRPYHQTMNENKGTLKMRDIKQREKKQRHQNAGVETARNGNNGTKLQGVGNASHEYPGKAE